MKLLLALVAAALAFEATNEWQKVDEGEDIPAGLDVQLNMETGERYVRLPQDNENSVALASIGPQEQNLLGLLDNFEDLAHDIDRGEEIMAHHFETLKVISEGAGQYADQAARVIQIALRQNPGAIKQVLTQIPSYPAQLISDIAGLTWRKLAIYGNLISVKQGADACYLNTEYLRTHLKDLKWDDKILKRLEAILEDLFHLGVPLQQWSKDLEKLAQEEGVNQIYYLKLLTRVVEVEAVKPGPEFIKWLSKLAAGRGGSDVENYAKAVRHSIYGNKHAERLHNEL